MMLNYASMSACLLIQFPKVLFQGQASMCGRFCYEVCTNRVCDLLFFSSLVLTNIKLDPMLGSIMLKVMEAMAV